MFRFSPHQEKGASLVEYALLLALIAIISTTAILFLGRSTGQAICQVAGNVAGLSGTTYVAVFNSSHKDCQLTDISNLDLPPAEFP